jgi:hypothetical protein
MAQSFEPFDDDVFDDRFIQVYGLKLNKQSVDFKSLMNFAILAIRTK